MLKRVRVHNWKRTK